MPINKTEAPVVIIGGGIAGCATAYYLAKRGVSALLLERGTFGGEASGRAAGGVRAQCRDSSAERLLAMHSIQLWQNLEAEIGESVEYDQGGNLRLAQSEAALDELRAEAEEERADGLAVEVWDAAELYRRASYLAENFVGAKYCATDGIANPKLAAPALARAAQRLGARTWSHTEALHVEVTDGQVVAVTARGARGEHAGEWRIETPCVVHAAGPWTPQLGRDLGLEIPIESSRAIIGRSEPLPFMFSEFLSSHELGVYARPDRRGCIHVGATGYPIHTFDDCTEAGVREYIARGATLVPALADVPLAEVWWGTLAMTPDRLPIIGPVPGIEGYLLATGFSGHGFCLGPAVGDMLSQLIVEDETALALASLRLTRFADGEREPDTTQAMG